MATNPVFRTEIEGGYKISEVRKASGRGYTIFWRIVYNDTTAMRAHTHGHVTYDTKKACVASIVDNGGVQIA